MSLLVPPGFVCHLVEDLNLPSCAESHAHNLMIIEEMV
jgi:hypothetical protein